MPSDAKITATRCRRRRSGADASVRRPAGAAKAGNSSDEDRQQDDRAGNGGKNWSRDTSTIRWGTGRRRSGVRYVWTGGT